MKDSVLCDRVLPSLLGRKRWGKKKRRSEQFWRLDSFFSFQSFIMMKESRQGRGEKSPVGFLTSLTKKDQVMPCRASSPGYYHSLTGSAEHPQSLFSNKSKQAPSTLRIPEILLQKPQTTKLYHLRKLKPELELCRGQGKWEKMR